ncbi:DUF4132 domain-containing protein [Actinomadura xylanilytica]|uniref:DUF4132 domain-containing protein n=1 Tax=Actinomadura xylanilytica TaxID=887459 RepID=UPI00255B2FDF|nr:DUF4132 domain-containing protein [Actinomadura xylanilytica]MDL4773913.1 DUF4132 domain-containing protein [Actinomadura xylanilytica]
MSDERPPARDEDVLVLPSELRRRLHPRRGGHPGPAIKIDKTAAEWLLEQREHVPDPASRIATGASDPDWAAGARRYLAGEADPVGAAAVALIPWKIHCTAPGSGDGYDWAWEGSPATGRWVKKWAKNRGLTDERAFPPPEGGEEDWVRGDYGGWSRGGTVSDSLKKLQRGFVDAWSAEHGVVFAACALVELSTAAATWVGDAKVRFQAGKKLWLGQEAGRRMRTLLAAADDGDYREAVERLAEHRRTIPQKAVVSYLVPTRQDWRCHVDDGPIEPWLSVALGEPKRLAMDNALAWEDHPLDLLVTLADTFGADALPLFVQGLDGDIEPAERKRLLTVIGLMPFDEAFQALVDRADEQHVGSALTTAMTRFPARALRMLAAAGATGALTAHVRAHPELAAAMLPDLPAGPRTAVEAAVAADPRVPDAEPDDLPELLVRPPWTREARKPVVIAGLEPPGGQTMAWAPDERAAWSTPVLPYWAKPGTDWETVAERLRSEGRSWYREVELLLLGPEEVSRPLLAGWEGKPWWDSGDVPWARCVVARFGTDASELALQAAKADPAGCGELLLPYLNAEIAALTAGWLARRKSARQVAADWFGRHGVDAARMLFPAALGKTGRGRRDAEGALRLMAGRIGAEEIVAAARDLGAEAADAIGALVADPLEFLPDRMPAMGDWVGPGALPQILLRGRERALPVTASGHVITMLAMSSPGQMYAGVGAVREVCDGRSLAEFAWALLERWERHGAPAKDGWALDQLAWLGDDGTVRGLAAAIGAWPGEGGHQKAVRGLDVLAAIGTDLALMHLNGISRRVKFKGLKARAQDKIGEIAASRGLTREQLADRMVPDFGLDDDGSMTLDYGPRRFTVGFDEALTPFVLDQDGRMRKTLPKPGANDDPDLAPAAYQRFASMKKVARTASADQIRRLETAMVTRRRWTAAEFGDLFVAHPLVWHIARRLVWLAEDEAVTAFRVAEDRTFTDVHDDAFTLPGTATVGIPHPLELGGDLAAWREVLEDYEIVQPFPQTERGTHAFTEEERRSGHLARFEGLTVRTARVHALRHRGWERARHYELLRALPAGRHVQIDLDPGLASGGQDDEPEQRIETVQLIAGTHFGELDPVTASEILADLTSLPDTPPGG